VTETAVNVTGTIANLQRLEWISVQDLLYGMMLPSGNDAANLLAENLGAILYFDSRG
jgi:D-alanyl-D-alanine carboxypeptidase (penicillin-binding protein 5/6)